MRRAFIAVAFACTPGAVAACTPAQTQRAFTVVDAVEPAACIIANAFLPNSRAILDACHLADVFLPLVERAMVETRTAVARGAPHAMRSFERDGSATYALVPSIVEARKARVEDQ